MSIMPLNNRYFKIAGFIAGIALCVALLFYGYKTFIPRYKKSATADIGQNNTAVSPVVPKKLSIKELKYILMLTDNQVKRLEPIMKEEKLRRKAIFNQHSAAGTDGRSSVDKELQMFRKYYENMYSHILTDEQFKKYLQVRDARNEE